MSVIDKVVSWAVGIANDDSHRYVLGGWGPHYDCSHFVITAYKQAGVDTGASYTGDMYKNFTAKGFENVTSSVNLSTGAGMKKGDVLLNTSHHAAMVREDGGAIVHASSPSNGICCRSYYNYPWDFVLRYPERSTEPGISLTAKATITVPDGLGKYYTYMRWDMITNMGTAQGRLIKAAGKNYDSEGYGLVGNRYALAMTSTFGAIGDYVDVYMSNGRIIHGIIADEKSQEYTAWDNNPANKWGHENGQCIVEWVTNWRNHDNPPSDGSVLKVINYGSYFEYPAYATGGTEEYLYSENSYTEENKEPTVVWNNRAAENVHSRLQETSEIEPTGELEIYASGNRITNIVGNLSWKNSLYELSTSMSFETPKTDGAYLSELIYVPQEGDIIQQITNAEIFRGVVTKVDDGDINSNKYTVVDLGWYLNKTKQTYQFKNITAGDAITELCADLSITLAELPQLDTLVNEIYFDKTISDILTDILDKCNGDFNYDFVPSGLRIYRIGDKIAYPEFAVAEIVPDKYSVDYRGEVNHSRSIEEMRNSIKITSEKDSVYTELKVLQNREYIDKFGFLQEIIKIDLEKENADETASAALNKYCKVDESYSFTIIEKYDSYTRAGEIIVVDGVNYVIESTDHSFKSGHHYNKLTLRRT